MATFRIRTPDEYAAILWRRRYHVLVPFIIVSTALCYAIYRLPNVYKSQSLIIVDPPKISSNYVQPVNTLDVGARLNMIQRLVTSRTELQRLIERFNLYPELTKDNMPIEVIVAEMAKYINVDQYGQQNLNAFAISFKDQNPVVARDVTAELATRIINANSDSELQKVYATVDQIEQRVAQVRLELERIESDRARYLVRNPDAVPNQEQSLLGQLGSLSTVRQSQQISSDALRGQIATNEQLLGALKAQDNIEPETPLAVGQTEGQLRTKRAELDGKLKKLLTEYTLKHPEVKLAQAELDSINKEIDDLKNVTDQDKQAKTARRSRNPQILNLEIKLEADKRELAQKQTELARSNAEYVVLQERLRSTPLLAQEALKIDRDYNTLRKRYDDLLAQQDNARFSAKVINDFSGETFRLQDPANLPEAPVSPKRKVLYPLSLLLGLAIGVIAAAAASTRELVTVNDARDVAYYARLPLLVTVPLLVTETERRWVPIVETAKFVSIILLIAVATPLLYQLIKASGLLEMFMGNQ